MTWILHQGNGIAGMAGLEDRSVDVAILDPPYEAEAHTLGRRTKKPGWRRENVSGGDHRQVEVAALDFPPITREERNESALHLARVVRRWILVFCQIEAAHKWRAALEAGGAKYKRTGIWHKPDGQPQLSGDRPGMGYETIVIAHAAVKGKSQWNGGGRTAVWTCPKFNAERFDHQTQKPLALMEDLVRLFSNRGETIIDPFAGSGSTGAAALRHGRNFIGWEIDPKHAATARARLAEVREQCAFNFQENAI